MVQDSPSVIKQHILELQVLGADFKLLGTLVKVQVKVDILLDGVRNVYTTFKPCTARVYEAAEWFSHVDELWLVKLATSWNLNFKMLLTKLWIAKWCWRDLIG